MVRMKSNSTSIVLSAIIAAGFFLLGFIVGKSSLDRKYVHGIEQIPYGRIFEIKGYEEKKIYNPEDEFVKAELKIEIDYTSSVAGLPDEYKKRKMPLYVYNIASVEQLTRMKESLERNKYLKLVKHGDPVKQANADYEEVEINGKRKIRIIKGIYLKPDDYAFVK